MASHAASHAFHRRAMLRGAFAGVAGLTASGLSGGGFRGVGVPGLSGLSSVFRAGDVAVGAAEPVANQTATSLKLAGKRVIFLWLAGGSSQFEMWDPKPGRETGGPFRSIATRVPGYQIGELMPKTAAIADRLAVVRSLDTGISEHEQAADLISAGRPKEPALDYPEIGVVMAKELAARESTLPDYVSLFTTSEGRRRPKTGFLGARHSPLLLEQGLRPEFVSPPEGVDNTRYTAREELRRVMSGRFAERRAGADMIDGYNAAYQRVRGLMAADHLFDLERESAEARDRYGRTPFGEQCLLARRLIEAGVPVVKVARGFWDSHHDNFESHRELVPDFDHVFSVLITDLADRGLLDSTLVMVLSEFGRTPTINKDMGRDHYADAWSIALAGCGVRGGVIYGKTDDDGRKVVDGRATAWDLAATLYRAVGIDPKKEYHWGPRPVPIAKEDAKPIEAVLS